MTISNLLRKETNNMELDNKYLNDMINSAKNTLNLIPNTVPECTMYIRGILQGGISYAYRSSQISREQYNKYDDKINELLEMWEEGIKL